MAKYRKIPENRYESWTNVCLIDILSVPSKAVVKVVASIPAETLLLNFTAFHPPCFAVEYQRLTGKTKNLKKQSFSFNITTAALQ